MIDNNKVKRFNKIFGICSILLGVIMDIWIIFEELFIYYFSHPGFITRIGSLISYMLLIIAGILLIKKSKLNALFYLLFSVCLILDRFFFCIKYWDYVIVGEIITAILAEIAVFLFFYQKKHHAIAAEAALICSIVGIVIALLVFLSHF